MEWQPSVNEMARDTVELVYATNCPICGGITKDIMGVAEGSLIFRCANNVGHFNHEASPTLFDLPARVQGKKVRLPSGTPYLFCAERVVCWRVGRTQGGIIWIWEKGKPIPSWKD